LRSSPRATSRVSLTTSGTGSRWRSISTRASEASRSSSTRPILRASAGPTLRANAAVATAIVSDLQNAAVIGHLCSTGFAAALPIYARAGVVTISGSATASGLPSLGPGVFNRTAVADPDFDAWYALVTALPSDLAFRQDYQSEFGAPPLDFTDLYFDAASLLFRDLQRESKIVNGELVIGRAALAGAVRDTTNFQGVTCTITLDPLSGNRSDDPAALGRCAEG
jgi:ABC-type branched-subunit amino acid transport system substrate-binding protein